MCNSYWHALISSTEKVVGTATPQEPPEGWQASWNLSTGNELLVRYGSTTSTSDFNFELKNRDTADTMVWQKLTFSFELQRLHQSSCIDQINKLTIML